MANEHLFAAGDATLQRMEKKGWALEGERPARPVRGIWRLDALKDMR
jgi:hypothetical protein